MPNIGQKDLSTRDEPSYFSRQIYTSRRFYNPGALVDGAKPGSLSVIAGGWEKCAKGYSVERNSFPHYAIEFVVSGHGTLTLAGTRRELLPGVFFSYGPDVPHAIENDGNAPREKYFVNIACAEIADLFGAETALYGKSLRSVRPHSIQQSFEELTDYGIEHNPWSGRICANLIGLLILKMAESSVSGGDSSGIAYANYLRCVSLLNRHYLKFRSVDDIARACCVDVSYLCRLFRKYGHQSPYQYFLRLNMNHAADLLLQKRLQVQEVAEIMGYSDPMHFSRAFRKVMSVSPSGFVRLSLRGDEQADEAETRFDD
jgi:AraC-like DNA-binding protein